MDFRTFFLNMLGVMLVVVSIVGFITVTQSHYNVQQPLVNNSQVAYLTNLKGNISTIYATANNSQTGFYSQSPSTDAGGLFTTGIAIAGQLLSGTIQVIYDILVLGLAGTLGIDPAIVLILETMMIGGVVLLIWSLWRLGR